MRITMVGHASVVVEHDGVVVWTDPWLRGLAFNDGWAIHPEAVIDERLRSRVTHLWISHEHPDHLSIPTLRSLPDDERARLTVLYQRHPSPEVVTWLREQGFRDVIELSHGRWYRLTADLRIRSDQVGHEDSAMTFQGGGRCLLNLNDCKPPDSTLRRLVREVGPVDLLLDQFSIAGWAGNPGDAEEHAVHAAEAEETFHRHLALVAPRAVLPFASFMRFCHEQNVHLNAAGVPLDRIAARVPADQLLVLAPGDTYDLGAPVPDPTAALATYREARAALPDLPLERDDGPVPFEDVLATAGTRMEDLRGAYPDPVLRRIPAMRFVAEDLDRAVQVHPIDGVEELAVADASPALRTTSSVLLHAFRFRFGLATLLISGRYRLDDGAERAFERFKQLCAAYGSGYTSTGFLEGWREQRTRELVTNRWRDLYPQFGRKALGRDAPPPAPTAAGPGASPTGTEAPPAEAGAAATSKRSAGRAAKDLLARTLLSAGALASDRGLVLANDAVGFVTLGRWLRGQGIGSVPRVPTREHLYDLAIGQVTGRQPAYLEFGVYQGASLRHWSQHLPDADANLHGFDSFEGLPERWNAQSDRASYSSQGQLPEIDDDRVALHVGWFEDTLRDYRPPEHGALVVHLDADLYRSTLTVLDALEPWLVPGTLLLFDELHDANHELRAFDEYLRRTGGVVQAIAATTSSQQWLFELVAPPAETTPATPD